MLLESVWVTVLEVGERQMRIELSRALSYSVRGLEGIRCPCDTDIPSGVQRESVVRVDLDNVSYDEKQTCYLATAETKITRFYNG